MRVEPDLAAAASVVGFVLALCFVAKGITGAGAGGGAHGDGVNRGKELLAQSTEWYRMSESTSVPLFQYRHLVFATAYLHAARLVAPDEELKRYGTDTHRFAQTLESKMVGLAKKITKTCPASNPQTQKPTTVSWL